MTSAYLERAGKWFKNKSYILLIAIILCAFIIRIYYFNVAAGQPLWWDEAEYGTMAKHFAMGLDYILNNQRPFMFPWIMSLFFSAGVLEPTIKFLLVIIPSTALVFAVYLLGREMFNQKVGLIAAILTAINWSLIFWSSRLQPDSLSMVFQVLSMFFIWRYWKKPKTSLMVWAGVLASFGFNFKVSGLLVPMSLFIFILFKDRMPFLKNKDYWIFLAAFLVVLIPQFIYSHVEFGSVTSFLFDSGYASVVLEEKPFGWYVFKFFHSLTENILFILFLAGLIISLKFLLYLDVLVKDKNRCFDSHIFSVIVLAVVLLFYVFYVRGAEDRWVFLWLPFMFFMIGEALTKIYDFARKYSKYLALGLVILLLAFASYKQITHADSIINLKKDSYAPVKYAGIWMRDNSAPQDRVFSISIPQTAYYSERPTRSYSSIKNASDFDVLLEKEHPRFLQLSIFEPHPPAINSWIQANQNRLKVVQIYFADAEQKQPALIIYEINYD